MPFGIEHENRIVANAVNRQAETLITSPQFLFGLLARAAHLRLHQLAFDRGR